MELLWNDRFFSASFAGRHPPSACQRAAHCTEFFLGDMRLRMRALLIQPFGSANGQAVSTQNGENLPQREKARFFKDIHVSPNES